MIKDVVYCLVWVLLLNISVLLISGYIFTCIILIVLKRMFDRIFGVVLYENE